MKKAIFILLTLVLALSATAALAADVLVGVAMPTQSLQRWNEDGANMKKALEEKGYIVDLQYAEDDVSNQIAQLENMITKGCKVLVIASIDGSALSDVLAKAADAKIPVIAYDRLIRQTPNVSYYATFDNFKVGVIQGKFIEEKLGLTEGKGPFNIEFFGGSPDDNNAFFFNGGAMSVLQPYLDKGQLVCQSGQTKMEQIGILGWKSEDAQARMDNLISKSYTDKKLDVVLSPNDSLAYGIAASLANNGYTPGKDWPIITGQDCDRANVKNMIAGKQSMSVFKDTRALAAKVAEMVDSIVQGKDPEVNDTKTYDNGVKVVPSYLLEPVFADINNYKTLLLDSGYYKEADLQ
ncbi:MAG TPA: sugar ABC transporter substrate-binding protein [Synergistaceae bacterium]|nr:sugar ABC transporter substrate-binding protein [Synergistaceae bacterium]